MVKKIDGEWYFVEVPTELQPIVETAYKFTLEKLLKL